MPKVLERSEKKTARLSSLDLADYFQRKLEAELGPHDLKHRMAKGEGDFVVLDVRSREGFQGGHIPGAKSIPFEELAERFKELPKDKEIISYCWDVTCLLCTRAALFLAKKGFQAKELLGGIEEWKKVNFPVEK